MEEVELSELSAERDAERASSSSTETPQAPGRTTSKQRSRRPSPDDDDEERPLTPAEQREQMRFYADQVNQLMLPILITYILTIWFVDSIYGVKTVNYEFDFSFSFTFSSH